MFLTLWQRITSISLSWYSSEPWNSPVIHIQPSHFKNFACKRHFLLVLEAVLVTLFFFSCLWMASKKVGMHAELPSSLFKVIKVHFLDRIVTELEQTDNVVSYYLFPGTYRQLLCSWAIWQAVTFLQLLRKPKSAQSPVCQWWIYSSWRYIAEICVRLSKQFDSIAGWKCFV